jgi:DivIVA domain-containing protein
MALDRQSVIRTDFPMSRRGYDRIAVDRHLDEIAQQLDGIERPVSVGATTSAHVQSILDAAEASAAEIERRAWDDASRVQDEADQAIARARVQVQALAAASRSLRERLDGLLTEVEALEGNLAEPGLRTAESEPTFDPQDTMAFDPIAEDEVAAQTAPPAPPAPAESRFGRDVPATDHRTGWLTQTPVAAPAWSTATTQPAGQEARESARLVALNMADGGQPREATDAYLADLYPAAERAALLDEIYRGR